MFLSFLGADPAPEDVSPEISRQRVNNPSLKFHSCHSSAPSPYHLLASSDAEIVDTRPRVIQNIEWNANKRGVYIVFKKQTKACLHQVLE